ncbi:MAG: M23 family metallopeptidase [Pseudomonadota bacterium]|nr:M23 family metallopeptidase [Pseudomonadota bacterium]
MVTPHVTDESYEYSDTPSAFDVTWPVFNGKVTQTFSLGKRRPHLGIDISAPRGSSIRASHDGHVVYAGNGFKGYGKMIIVDLDGHWATLYSHLSRISVKNGQKIERGQILGIIGRSGNATGIHLHFEIRRDKQATDPLKYLPAKTYITSN